MPRVNPEILVWARKTAGLPPEEAVKRLDISAARGVPAVDRLAALESGVIEPTRPLLVRMSKVYRRPLLTFYMSAPPRKANRGQDFRTLPDDYSESENILIDVLIRKVLARQEIIRALLEDEEETEPLDFVGSMQMSDGTARVIASIKEVLNFDHREFYAQSNPDKAFAFLRAKAEAVGVFVLLIGNLGSHHTGIKLEIFRGFALADKIAPFIVINEQDSHAAWSFTLLHELVHIWLGQTGISSSRSERELERFCNNVAGEILLPPEEIGTLEIQPETPVQDAEELITAFARQRNISNSMVAYTLYQRGAINRPTWIELSEIFRTRWLTAREERQTDTREREGGPSYYLIRRHRLGTPLIHLIDRMLASGSLTTSKAGQVLGVKAKNVQNLIETTRIT